MSADIPVGEHTITLHVPNGRAGEAMADVRITVGKSVERPPSGAPTLSDSLKELQSKTKMVIQSAGATNIQEPLMTAAVCAEPAREAAGRCCCKKV